MAIANHQYIQNEQTIISTGEFINVSNADTLVISIFGTSTSFALLFQGSLDGINYFNISGIKLSNPMAFSTTTSVIGEAWEFDVSALGYYKANLNAISNGSITVIANVPR